MAATLSAETGHSLPVLEPIREGCAYFSYDRPARQRYPRYLVRTDGSTTTDASVESLILFSNTILDRGEPFTMYWDLRECSVPGMGQLWRCIRWSTAEKKRIDANIKGIAIMTSSSALRNIVTFVLEWTKPPMPLVVCGMMEEADAFAEGLAEDRGMDETPTAEPIPEADTALASSN
jgi:hypothetical protein